MRGHCPFGWTALVMRQILYCIPNLYRSIGGMVAARMTAVPLHHVRGAHPHQR